MKWPYKVGTRVKINEVGHRRFGYNFANPRNTIGVVIKSDKWTTVKWKDGYINAYTDGTITIVQENLENV